MASLRLSLLILVAGSASLACYRPNIRDGGFLCPDGGACPDGFHCASDHRCYAGDGGPEVRPMCTDALPHLSSLCDDAPIGGECNPTCQNGCDCGRCTVVAGGSHCVSVGGKGAGGLCNLANDDCGAGFGCVREQCGTNLGRCRQFCGPKVSCSFGSCNDLGGPFSVCDPPPQSCDPMANTGCPDAALGCYVQASTTICDCSGGKQPGEICTFSSDCKPAFQCIAIGLQAPTCKPVCRTATDCQPPNTNCISTGGGFGFCSP